MQIKPVTIQAGVAIGRPVEKEDMKEIVTAYYAESEIAGGLIEVTDKFPWVDKDEEGLEKGLRDELLLYWGPENEFKEPIANEDFGPNNEIFINPKNVDLAVNGTVRDINGTDYSYCEIWMDDGNIYYLADFWENVAKRLDGGKKDGNSQV